MSRYEEFTLEEAIAIAKRNDPGPNVPSVSRTLLAEIARLREVAAHFLPVMEAMRPLVLNLELLRDIAADEPRYTLTDAGKAHLEGQK